MGSIPILCDYNMQFQCVSIQITVSPCEQTALNHKKILSKTRMHSNGMPTVRCSNHLGGGGGVCLGVCVHFLPPCGQTDTCENITFPQLLWRTVKINLDGWYFCNRYYVSKKNLQFSQKKLMASKRTTSGGFRIYQMKGDQGQIRDSP